MTKKREPIDDLINAHVWLAAQRRKKRAFAPTRSSVYFVGHITKQETAHDNREKAGIGFQQGFKQS